MREHVVLAILCFVSLKEPKRGVPGSEIWSHVGVASVEDAVGVRAPKSLTHVETRSVSKAAYGPGLANASDFQRARFCRGDKRSASTLCRGFCHLAERIRGAGVAATI